MRTQMAIVVACVLAGTHARAANFVVTTVTDAAEAPGTVGDGFCDVGGQCTLRAAVQEANATPALDTITVPAGTYVLSVADADDALPDLDVLNPLTITGAGPAVTIIDANHTGRVFDVAA